MSSLPPSPSSPIHCSPIFILSLPPPFILIHLSFVSLFFFLPSPVFFLLSFLHCPSIYCSSPLLFFFQFPFLFFCSSNFRSSLFPLYYPYIIIFLPLYLFFFHLQSLPFSFLLPLHYYLSPSFIFLPVLLLSFLHCPSIYSSSPLLSYFHFSSRLFSSSIFSPSLFPFYYPYVIIRLPLHSLLPSPVPPSFPFIIPTLLSISV